MPEIEIDREEWQERTCPKCWTRWTGNSVARRQQGNLCSTCWRNSPAGHEDDARRRGSASCRCDDCQTARFDARYAPGGSDLERAPIASR